MELDTEELEATKNREKTADEMFKELGYEKQENGLEIKYIEDSVVMGDKFHFEIFFSKISKLIGSKHLLTMQELQAINKKVEELRMEVEKCKFCSEDYSVLNPISNEYSGLEISLMTKIKCLRVRAYMHKELFETQDVVNIKYCCMCGRKLV